MLPTPAPARLKRHREQRVKRLTSFGKLALALSSLTCSGIASAQEGFAGSQPDMALPANGLPLIAYLKSSRLRLLRCAEVRCRTASSSGDLDVLFGRPRIALRNDGRPIIVYRGGPELGLRAFDCADSACSAGVSRSLDPVAVVNVGVAIRPNGKPLIVYGDAGSSVRAMKVYDCADPNCETGSARIPAGQQVMSQGGTALTDGGTAIAMRSSGLAILTSNAINAGGQDRMQVYECADEGCATGTVSYHEKSGATATAIRGDGTAFVAYTGNLSMLRGLSCLDAACSTGDVTGNLDQALIDFDLVMRSGDLPIISYISFSGSDLQVYDCENAGCSAGTIHTLDTVSPFANYPSMIIRANGRPLIAYSINSATAGLRIADCHDSACESSTTYAISPDALFSDGFESLSQ